MSKIPLNSCVLLMFLACFYGNLALFWASSGFILAIYHGIDIICLCISLILSRRIGSVNLLAFSIFLQALHFTFLGFGLHLP